MLDLGRDGVATPFLGKTAKIRGEDGKVSPGLNFIIDIITFWGLTLSQDQVYNTNERDLKNRYKANKSAEHKLGLFILFALVTYLA